MLDDAGRPHDAVGTEAMLLSNKGPDDIAAKMQAWADQGGTHASVVTMGLGLDSTEAHLDYVSSVAEAIGKG